jgi:hypothetical protein
LSMQQSHYYTLVASLPHLPRFDRAKRLPINRQQLDLRLHMLSEEDAEVVQLAERFISWQHQPIERTDQEMISFHRKVLATSSNPVLHGIIGFRMDMRTLLAALRLRSRGEGPPAVDAAWGIGPLAQDIRRHWNDPWFHLEYRYPWLPEVARLLEAGDSFAVEKRTMRLIWDHLGQIADFTGFGFDTVLGYLFRWDLVARWLSYEPKVAALRFEHLVTEAIGNDARLFH